jgi:hypothetical protein
MTSSRTGEEDFIAPSRCEVTLRLTAPVGTGAQILHIRYDHDQIDDEPPIQFTVRSGAKILVLLVEATEPGALLRLMEVSGEGEEQVIDRFHFDPRNPARGYIITGL